MTMATLSLEAEAPLVLEKLAAANARFSKRYPGASERRQPVHTVYGGAQLFRSDIAKRLGKGALASLDAYGPDAISFARAIGLSGADTLPTKKKAVKRLLALSDEERAALRTSDRPAWLALTVYDRVRRKLLSEPVEDFRIDFEDGFGNRPDDEEDATAVVAAEEVAKGYAAGELPPFIGIRIKPLNEELKRRSARTLDIFLTTLVARLGGELPKGFVVTLPKVPVPEQVSALAELLDMLESKLGLEAGAVSIELMIELTQSIFDAEGTFLLPRLLAAANGRCSGAHFGTYDYTASNDITAAYQTMSHPACQLAIALMKIAYTNTGIQLSDGATNVLPVPIHRSEELSKDERAANLAAVHGAWELAHRHIRASLENGVYQGWDLHPAQLPVRYAATYAFFLEGFDAAALRLSNFISKAAQATLVGDVFDDAATGQGLLNYFLMAQNAGAVTPGELEVSGLSRDEIALRSFVKILAGRTGGGTSAPPAARGRSEPVA